MRPSSRASPNGRCSTALANAFHIEGYERQCSPIITVCSTVRCGNRRMFWNVSATPRSVRRGGRGAAEASRPEVSVGDTPPLEGDLPAIGRENAGHQIEERGLAGAVRSDQRMDVAARDLHAQIVQRIEAAEALAQALDRKAGV